jgi:glycosyltransferase involved in cell wall biosynthesis
VSNHQADIHSPSDSSGADHFREGYPLVSIVIPCYNEETFIGTILENILSQDYPRESLEVLIVDGFSTDQTRSVIQSYTSLYSFIRLVDNEKQFVPFALNLGIAGSKGEVIMIMGSHSVYPNNYVSVLVAALYDLNADNVGGICDTLPMDDSVRAHSIASVLSSRFGVGNAYFRIGTNKRMKVDTVTFGCYRREVFDKIGRFDEELLRNQDDEFNARLIRNGGSIWLLPEIKIGYYARGTVLSLLRMYYQYGLFKPLVSQKNKGPATLRQLIPPCFVIFLVGGIVLSFFWTLFRPVFLGVLALYLLIDLSFCITISQKKKSASMMLYMPWLFFLLHCSYGVGYIAGIVNFVLLKKRKIIISSNR